ncbi:MAG: winged helix-turn-helix domain-containing protein [Clostridia bacterium]
MKRGIYVAGQADTYKRLREHFKGHSLQLIKERPSASAKYQEIMFIVIDSLEATTTPTVLEYRGAYPRASILVLTPVKDEQDLVNALAYGADDYQVKPCSDRELATRIRVILKRREQASASHPANHFVLLDREARSLEWNGDLLHLTKIECRLLELLVASKQRIVGREEIIQEIWENRIQHNSKAIDVHICNLRKKLWEASAGRISIKTVTNKGFYLTTELNR